VKDGRVKCAEETYIKSEYSKTVTQGVMKSESAGSHPILHIPTSDHNKIPPKADCWIREPEICIDDEVSGAVSCNVVPM
jgi:hypothetical protein